MPPMDGRFDAKSLCQANPDGIILVDGAGDIVYANNRIEDILGYDPAELQGEPVEVLVPEADREEHVDLRDAYFEDMETRPMGVDLDLRACREDGETIPVAISLSPVSEGDSPLVMAAIRDVSEQVALRRKYQTVIETVPDAVFVAEVETGRLVEVNPAATALSGYPEDDLLGAPQTLLHPDGEEERYREFFETHVAGKDAVYSTFPEGEDLYLETADGEHVPVEINAQVVELEGRRVAVGVFRDISEQKRYERQLERQVDRLESLTSVVAHDLRNPLQVADGRVDLYEHTGDIEHLEKLKDAHGRMETIIDEMLVLIRNGDPLQPGTLEPVDVGEMADGCWSMVETAGATLSVEGTLAVMADRDRLRHLFENLFRNSVEHGTAGDGSVEITVGPLPERPGFYVEDDGSGIPPAEREHIFDTGFTTTPSGTGLGLSIVKEIVESHGWTISVTEGAAGGARFEVSGVDLA